MRMNLHAIFAGFWAYFEFGDVNYICPKPSITKSRPTKAYVKSGKNYWGGGYPTISNSTLLNLEKIVILLLLTIPILSTKQDKLFYQQIKCAKPTGHNFLKNILTTIL